MHGTVEADVHVVTLPGRLVDQGAQTYWACSFSGPSGGKTSIPVHLAQSGAFSLTSALFGVESPYQ